MRAPDVSAVLLSAKRPGNILKIVGSLLGQPFVSEVIVFHNKTRECPHLPEHWATRIDPPKDTIVVPGAPYYQDVARAGLLTKRLLIVNAAENYYTFGRYLAVNYATCEWIAVQDDDCIVKPETWEQLYAARHPAYIAAAQPPNPFRGDKKRHWGTAHEVFVGWGAIFHRMLVAQAFGGKFDEASLDSTEGARELFRRKADRLFTILCNAPHTVICAEHEALPLDSERGIALYREADHMRLTIEARRLALTRLGIPFKDVDISWQ